MDYRDLQQILNNLSDKLSCPHCKAKITKQYLKVLNVFEKDCVFYVLCPQCKAHMVMGAHMEHQPSKKELTSNYSSRIQMNSTLSNITEVDVTNIQKNLESFSGGFNKLFGVKKGKK